jgi:hypothetical protein
VPFNRSALFNQAYEKLFKLADKKNGGSFYLQSKVLQSSLVVVISMAVIVNS